MLRNNYPGRYLYDTLQLYESSHYSAQDKKDTRVSQLAFSCLIAKVSPLLESWEETAIYLICTLVYLTSFCTDRQGHTNNSIFAKLILPSWSQPFLQKWLIPPNGSYAKRVRILWKLSKQTKTGRVYQLILGLVTKALVTISNHCKQWTLHSQWPTFIVLWKFRIQNEITTVELSQLNWLPSSSSLSAECHFIQRK